MCLDTDSFGFIGWLLGTCSILPGWGSNKPHRAFWRRQNCLLWHADVRNPSRHCSVHSNIAQVQNFIRLVESFWSTTTMVFRGVPHALPRYVPGCVGQISEAGCCHSAANTSQQGPWAHTPNHQNTIRACGLELALNGMTNTTYVFIHAIRVSSASMPTAIGFFENRHLVWFCVSQVSFCFWRQVCKSGWSRRKTR